MTDWPTRYSEFSPLILAELRLAVTATMVLSECYPQHAVNLAEFREARLLAGYENWRTKQRDAA